MNLYLKLFCVTTLMATWAGALTVVANRYQSDKKNKDNAQYFSNLAANDALICDAYKAWAIKAKDVSPGMEKYCNR